MQRVYTKATFFKRVMEDFIEEKNFTPTTRDKNRYFVALSSAAVFIGKAILSVSRNPSRRFENEESA